MVNSIREKRKFIIENKRITVQTLRDLANIIEHEVKASKQESGESKVVVYYSVDAVDGSSFESQSAGIFDQELIVDRKVIQKVAIRFNTIDYSKSIEVNIVHSIKQEEADSYISVGGDDSNWVNGVMSRLTEVISICQSQPVKLLPYWQWIQFVGVVLCFGVFIFFLKRFEKLPDAGFSKLLLQFGPPALFAIGVFRLGAQLETLWPELEIQTGPVHLQTQVVKRNIVIQIFLIVIIPVALSILSEQLIEILK